VVQIGDPHSNPTRKRGQNALPRLRVGLQRIAGVAKLYHYQKIPDSESQATVKNEFSDSHSLFPALSLAFPAPAAHSRRHGRCFWQFIDPSLHLFDIVRHPDLGI
jgi:hypothetical protein